MPFCDTSTKLIPAASDEVWAMYNASNIVNEFGVPTRSTA